MTKRIEITAWCDLCEEPKPAETLVVAMAPEGKARPTMELDLCEAHWTTFVDPLAQAVEAHGRKAEAEVRPTKRGYRRTPTANADHRTGLPPKGPRDLYCLWCPLTYAHPTGLVRHYRVAHGLAKNLGQVYGTTCPLCAHQASTFQSLSRHTATQHGARHVAAAFSTALWAGDPHGIVAKVYAQRGVKAATQTLGELAARKP